MDNHSIDGPNITLPRAQIEMLGKHFFRLALSLISSGSFSPEKMRFANRGTGRDQLFVQGTHTGEKSHPKAYVAKARHELFWSYYAGFSGMTSLN